MGNSMDQEWTIRILGTLVVLFLLAYLVQTVWQLTERDFRGALTWRVVGLIGSVLLCAFLLLLVVVFTLQN